MKGAQTEDADKMSSAIENGAKKSVNGKLCVYYDGYWIRYYAPPKEGLTAKQTLIVSLTRRAFHHTEHGINTPGYNLDMARQAWGQEQDPALKRVNGAMLAGALFNRATRIFTAIVDLSDKGVKVNPDNELMRECEACLREAMELGHTVKHYSGEEGIDELWGEPLKAFTMSVADFYVSRYRKIAHTMTDIDAIANCMIGLFGRHKAFRGVCAPIRDYAEAAKLECETMKSDPAIFKVWPQFVAAGERLESFSPLITEGTSERLERQIREGLRLLINGKNVIAWIAGARVPMPQTLKQFLERCDACSHQLS